MIVKLIETGKPVKVSASYGMRLIEQGKAVAEHSGRKTAPKAVRNDKDQGDA